MRALARRTAFALTAATGLAHAYEGHGLGGSHWHATDSFGLVALAVVLALGLWFTRK